jgi:apolipoprotein D and lipocalin family protein
VGGVQVFWPIKAQYIVAYLKDDYSQTIVARDARLHLDHGAHTDHYAG